MKNVKFNAQEIKQGSQDSACLGKNLNSSPVSTLILRKTISMRKYTTFAEMENLLLTAIGLSGSSIKTIAVTTGIKENALYKRKTTLVHLSPEKADKLLLYFMEHEPYRLELAELVLSQKSREY